MVSENYMTISAFLLKIFLAPEVTNTLLLSTEVKKGKQNTNEISFFSFSYLIVCKSISHFLKSLHIQNSVCRTGSQQQRFCCLRCVISSAFSKEPMKKELKVSVTMLVTVRKKHNMLFLSIAKWKGGQNRKIHCSKHPARIRHLRN